MTDTVDIPQDNVPQDNVDGKTDNIAEDVTNAIKTAEEISEIAEATGSNSVIAALIFGFAFAFLSGVNNDNNVNPYLFGTFAIFLMGTIGLSFWGLIVSSIWFGAAKMIIGWKVLARFNQFERETYTTRIGANYAIYTAEITLIITVTLYCYVIYDK
eukprot:370006_1